MYLMKIMKILKNFLFFFILQYGDLISNILNKLETIISNLNK